MRKIEHEMITALYNWRNWTNANTSVSIVNNTATVTLHGHVIARIVPVGDYGSPHRNLELCWTTYQHFSRTTFSRMNAILRQFVGPGVGVYTRKQQPYLMRRLGMGEKTLEVGDRYSFTI